MSCVSIFYCALNCNVFKLLLIGHIKENINKNELKSDKLPTYIVVVAFQEYVRIMLCILVCM